MVNHSINHHWDNMFETFSKHRKANQPDCIPSQVLVSEIWGLSLILSEDPILVGGFTDFLFSSLLGEMIQFDEYFSNGLKPPTSYLFEDT